MLYCLFYTYLSGGHRVQETCMRGKTTRLLPAKEHIWKPKVPNRGYKWCVFSFKRVPMLSFTRSQCWANLTEHQWTWLGWTDHIHSTCHFLLAPPLLCASTHSQIRVKQATMPLMEVVRESICIAAAGSVRKALDPWHWCSRYKQRGATNIQTNEH